MCGRYFIDDGEAEMMETLRLLKDTVSVKTGEIYPTNTAPVLRNGGSGVEAAALKWGYPRWNGGGAVINARAETALEKNMFRRSMLERRCVVPSSGFYEWNRVEGRKEKDKYLIRRPHSACLYMAGAWNEFKGPEGPYEAFVILTTRANEYMVPGDLDLTLFPEGPRPIHDRMPVLLDREEQELWLTNDGYMDIVLHRPGLDLTLTKTGD